MARTKSIDLRGKFREALSPKRIWAMSREAGFVQRASKINPFVFVWSLVLGFGAGSARTVSSLRRGFEGAAGVTLVPSSFYERFNAGLVELLRRIVAHLLATPGTALGKLGGSLEGFRDVMLTDASVLRLRDRLEKLFPACRTNHTKAAAKLHAVMSVTGAGHESISVTGERTNDRHALKIGPWVKDRLLLLDLGYFGYRLFDRIRRNEGSFISRLKTNGNPRIVAVNRRWRGKSVPLVGERLQDVLPRLKREVLDVMVEVTFMRRTYARKMTRATTTFRLVGVRDTESGEYHLYVTNVPSGRLSAESVALAYRARWGIELLFKAWKSEFRLDELPSRRPEVVRALIYSAVITMLITRRLHALLRARLGPKARRATAGRVAALVRQLAVKLLEIVVSASHDRRLERDVSKLLLHEAVEPHLRRIGLLERASGIGRDSL